MTSSRLRELSRAASPAPWEHAIDPVRGPTYEIWADFANRIGCHIGTPDADLIVALRNDAEKYADLRDAVEAVREAFNAPWHSVPDMERVRHDALNKAFAALAALGGEE